MKTRTIEIDGEMKEVYLYESLAEYVEDTVLANSPYKTDSDEPYIIREFDLRKIFDDIRFNRIEFFEDYNIDGKQYIRVNWGEEEICMIQDSGFGMYYAVYQKVGKDKHDMDLNLYTCLIPKLFETKDEAAEAGYYRINPSRMI